MGEQNQRTTQKNIKNDRKVDRICGRWGQSKQCKQEKIRTERKRTTRIRGNRIGGENPEKEEEKGDKGGRCASTQIGHGNHDKKP